MIKINTKKIILLTILTTAVFQILNISASAASVDPDTLLNRPKDNMTHIILTTQDGSTPYEDQLTNVDNLPAKSIEETVGLVIKTVLRWSFYLTLIALVMASIHYIMSMGKEEDIVKARNIILYLVIGMAIIAGAYGIVGGISRFNFFSADTNTQESPQVPNQ